MLVSGAFRLLPGLCLIHIQCTFIQQGAIQISDRFVSVFCVGHLHKAEPAWLAGVAVYHDLDLGYRPECCEKLAKCAFRGAEIEIPNKNVLHGAPQWGELFKCGRTSARRSK